MGDLNNANNNFSKVLEQAYWDRRLALLKSKNSANLYNLNPEIIEGEIVLLETFRSWLKQARTFNVDKATRIVKAMTKVVKV